MNHPIQPLEKNEHGTIRFKENKIVSYILESGGISLNDLAAKEFSGDDRRQFAQLIGYSHSGYGSLSYADDYTYEVAEKMFNSEATEVEARIAYLEEMVAGLKRNLRGPMAELFEKHPEDLCESLG